MLVDELHKQIYVKSVSGVVKGFQRQGSQRQSGKKDKTSLVKQVLTGTATEDIQGEAFLNGRYSTRGIGGMFDIYHDCNCF